MIKLPTLISEFCIRFFDLLDDSELNDALIPLLRDYAFPDRALSVRVQTNHLDYHVEDDFQFQMEINPSEIRVWCCCVDIDAQRINHFMYHHSRSDGDLVLGEMSAVEERILEKFRNGYFRGMVWISVQGL